MNSHLWTWLVHTVLTLTDGPSAVPSSALCTPQLTPDQSSDKGVCVCVSLVRSPFWREAIASLRLLNSPIRYKAAVTHEGWVSVTSCCVASVKLCCCNAKLYTGTHSIKQPFLSSSPSSIFPLTSPVLCFNLLLSCVCGSPVALNVPFKELCSPLAINSI